MNQRRVFLQVLGAGAFASACGGSDSDSDPTGSTTSGAGSTASGAGGDPTGGAGGATASSADASSTSAEASSSQEAAASTGAGGGLPPNYKVVGKVSDIPQGLLKPVSSASVLLGRDAGGVYVMTSLCPHKLCDMCIKGNVNPSGITCTCHGSKFDAVGTVTTGPSLKSLDHYECAVAMDGSIGVDKAKVVPASFRAMVP